MNSYYLTGVHGSKWLTNEKSIVFELCAKKIWQDILDKYAQYEAICLELKKRNKLV